MQTHTRLDSFRIHADEFTSVVDAVPADAWGHASPCAGWTAADVLDHVVDSQRDFLARQGVLDEDRPTGSPAEIWSAHESVVRRVLGAAGVMEREYDGWFGRTTIGATITDFYDTDLVVHRWDLARAAGRPADFSEAEMDQLEASFQVYGDAMYADGVFGQPVDVPGDAPRADRLLATMGRDPGWAAG